MTMFERGDLRIHYEESGSGFPLLLFAPGGMRSSIEFWSRVPFDPMRELSPHFRVIAMDQRNAGSSRGPVSADDGWHTYAADHLALLDHLGVERCHVLGCCIGGSFCLRLAQAAPERVASAVLLQPIGLHADNRPAFNALFDSWAQELEQREQADRAQLAPFCQRMYGGDFVFSVSREFVRSCATPLLVMLGNDIYHPSEISREIAQLAPDAQLIERWKDADVVPDVVRRLRAFLQAHTPG